MRVEKHDLAHEFPEYRDQIHRLKTWPGMPLTGTVECRPKAAFSIFRMQKLKLPLLMWSTAVKK